MKLSALVKNVCTFLSYFILFVCIFEVITDFVLLLTMTLLNNRPVVPQVYSIRRISLKKETLHVATFQCVITAMETSGELL